MTGARHLKAGQYTKAGPQVCVHRCTLSPSVYVVIGELVLSKGARCTEGNAWVPRPGSRIPGQQPPRGSLLLLGVANSLGLPEHQWAHGAGPQGLTVPAAHSQPPALSQLVSLYLGRSHFLWKEPATMSWLEENVHKVLQAVDAGDPAVEACESR